MKCGLCGYSGDEPGSTCPCCGSPVTDGAAAPGEMGGSVETSPFRDQRDAVHGGSFAEGDDASLVDGEQVGNATCAYDAVKHGSPVPERVSIEPGESVSTEAAPAPAGQVDAGAPPPSVGSPARQTGAWAPAGHDSGSHSSQPVVAQGADVEESAAGTRMFRSVQVAEPDDLVGSVDTGGDSAAADAPSQPPSGAGETVAWTTGAGSSESLSSQPADDEPGQTIGWTSSAGESASRSSPSLPGTASGETVAFGGISDPRLALAHQAEIAVGNGDLDSAINLYMEALRVAPGHQGIHERLEALWAAHKAQAPAELQTPEDGPGGRPDDPAPLRTAQADDETPPGTVPYDSGQGEAAPGPSVSPMDAVLQSSRPQPSDPLPGEAAETVPEPDPGSFQQAAVEGSQIPETTPLGSSGIPGSAPEPAPPQQDRPAVGPVASDWEDEGDVAQTFALDLSELQERFEEYGHIVAEPAEAPKQETEDWEMAADMVVAAENAAEGKNFDVAIDLYMELLKLYPAERPYQDRLEELWAQRKLEMAQAAAVSAAKEKRGGGAEGGHTMGVERRTGKGKSRVVFWISAAVGVAIVLGLGGMALAPLIAERLKAGRTVDLPVDQGGGAADAGNGRTDPVAAPPPGPADAGAPTVAAVPDVGPPPPRPARPAKGTVRVTSRPAGATVTVNGARLPEPTPCSVTRRPGTYLIVVSMAGRSPAERRIDLRSGQRLTVDLSLKRVARRRSGSAKATVGVFSRPGGAKVLVNGVDTGQRTPTTLTLSPRRTRIYLMLPGYRRAQRVLTLRAGRRTKISVTLEALLAQLKVVSTPSGAAVRIGGRSTGKVTPAVVKARPGAAISVAVELKGHKKPASKSVVPRSNRLVTVSFSLTKKAGRPVTGMVWVRAGTFLQGSNFGSPNEAPARQVWLSAFRIDRTEVTVAAYRKCMESGRCKEPGRWPGCNLRIKGRENHPVNCVSWYQARRYCRWAGKKLPTEAQWEKAARGSGGRMYPWGNTPPSCTRAVMRVGAKGCGRGGTWPVGSKRQGRSPYGALDMAGNVREWVRDAFDPKFYRSAPKRNPYQSLNSSGYKVIRGGGWDSRASEVHSSARHDYWPSKKVPGIGFRCVK